jgi:hypothetical protein
MVKTLSSVFTAFEMLLVRQFFLTYRKPDECYWGFAPHLNSLPHVEMPPRPPSKRWTPPSRKK